MTVRAPDPSAVAAAADRAEARAGGLREPPRGRGRLSTIDLLPPEAEEDKVWALGELAKAGRKQQDILFELNDRLAAKGLDGISSSAFNRKAMRVAVATRRMQDARAMFEGVAGQFTAKDVDENTVVLGEFMKTLIIELVVDRSDGASPKDAMELARAFQATVSAQKISTDRRQKLETEMKAQLMKAAETAVGEVAEAGQVADPKAVLKRIREDVYGIFER